MFLIIDIWEKIYYLTADKERAMEYRESCIQNNLRQNPDICRKTYEFQIRIVEIPLDQPFTG